MSTHYNNLLIFTLYYTLFHQYSWYRYFVEWKTIYAVKEKGER
jgi:hypothetical protein